MKLAITSKTALCLALKRHILRAWGEWLRMCRSVWKGFPFSSIENVSSIYREVICYQLEFGK